MKTAQNSTQVGPTRKTFYQVPGRDLPLALSETVLRVWTYLCDTGYGYMYSSWTVVQQLDNMMNVH